MRILGDDLNFKSRASSLKQTASSNVNPRATSYRLLCARRVFAVTVARFRFPSTVLAVFIDGCDVPACVIVVIIGMNLLVRLPLDIVTLLLLGLLVLVLVLVLVNVFQRTPGPVAFLAYIRSTIR
jgi:hypothetical protein